MRRSPFAALPLLALACAALPVVAAGTASRNQHPAIYRCATDIQNIDGGFGRLSLSKSFFEDGAVAGMEVYWEDRTAPFVRPHLGSGGASATFRWPSDRITMRPPPFSWSNGSIHIGYTGAGSEGRYQPRQRERWRQVLVVRDGSVLIHGQGSERFLYLYGHAHLMTDLQELSTSGSLFISIDSLLAWGAGAERVTVYELLVKAARARRTDSSTNPVEQRRIITSYDIDMTALARVVGTVRRMTEEWEATLTDFRRDCERASSENTAIIIPT